MFLFQHTYKMAFYNELSSAPLNQQEMLEPN